VLARVAAWGDPWALLLAPAVLLQRKGDSPITRLQRLAITPQLVEEYYWHVAEEEEERPAQQQVWKDGTPISAERLRAIELMAAVAPARAVKMLEAAAAAKPEEVRAEMLAKTVRPPEPFDEDMEWKKPEWIHFETVLKAVATRSARAAAPGWDGWTRELILASASKTTVPLLELAVNAIARDEVPSQFADCLRACKVVAWAKPQQAGKFRIVGMTSAIVKVVWRVVAAQHFLQRKLAPCQATFAKGGVWAVARWADSVFRSGTPVVTADIVDAFWRVDRRTMLRILNQTHSPLTGVFRFVYRNAVPCVHGKLQYAAQAALIPGCGGAATLFSIYVAAQVRQADPKYVGVFADDITTVGVKAFEGIRNTIEGDLAKIQVIAPDPTLVPTELRPYCVPAGRVLGAYV
jgi:hypothetical protein